MESEMNKLESKIAVVTGASHGIGRAIAERLARDGAAVVINYSSREAEAASIVSEIEAAGGKALAVQADVTKRDDIARLFAEADRAYGRLDILVNNAGVGALGPLDEIVEATWDRVFALNAKAPLFVTQEAGPADGRRRPDRERLLDHHLLSASGHQRLRRVQGRAPHLHRGLAKELGPKGITGQLGCPGPTIPGMFENAPEVHKISAAAQSPFNRIGTPGDIASVVSFLASEDAGWVTGQHIVANGGATI
jgi:3-oxoacyl-[acyl-carrier protein] reductase